jgi:hypothetical protein
MKHRERETAEGRQRHPRDVHAEAKLSCPWHKQSLSILAELGLNVRSKVAAPVTVVFCIFQ